MQIVIEISERDYELMKASICKSSSDFIILNGTPLPKGHGRLIDVDALNEAYTYECISECDRCEHCSKDGHGCELLLNAPTILESDKAESEESE